ncbi:MAG: hypothetical protein OXC68_04825 [Aestuariivita sp.]|nr:hypothetical protein [Aestuariivita sp.]
MDAVILERLIEGGVMASLYGGLFCGLLVLVGVFKCRRGAVVSVMRGCQWVVLGAMGCVVLYAAGFDALGLGALVGGFFWGWSTLETQPG